MKWPRFLLKEDAVTPISRRSEFESCWSLHFFCKVFEKNENKQKEQGLAHLMTPLDSSINKV